MTRLELYQMMLTDWNKEERYTNFGFCAYLKLNLECPKIGLKDLPELTQQKPEDSNSNFWWTPGLREPRIKALQEAIKLCK